MNTSKVLSTMHEFMASAELVKRNIQHIERLSRRANIYLGRMEMSGVVDHAAVASIVQSALDLRLIDKSDADHMKPETVAGVSAAFDMIKLNTAGIVQLAWSDPRKFEVCIDPCREMADPNRELMEPLLIPIRREGEQQRRHFSDFTL